MRSNRHLPPQSGKPGLRTVGGCLFVFAAVEIFVINHAGWNWGIIQTIEPRQYYDRYAVSAFALLLATVITKEIEANPTEWLDYVRKPGPINAALRLAFPSLGLTFSCREAS